MTTVPTSRVLRLQVRRADLKMVAVVDRYLEAEIVPKFNPVSLETCGTFLVRLPMQVRDDRGRMRPYRAATALLEDGAGLVASLDGVRFFSGFVEVPERSRRGSGSAMLEVFGYSDDSLFAVRNAWPLPTSGALVDQDGQAQDIRRGPAETVAKAYWTANAAATSARVSARVPGLTIPPTAGLGSTVVGRARFDNLAALSSDLCSKGGGLGWRILQQGTGLTAEVFQPRDRSKHARFSPALRNLTEYRYATPRRTVSHAVVAGGGEGVNRLFRESLTPTDWWGYRETYIDRRQAGGGLDEPLTTVERAEVEAELDQEAADAIMSGGPPSSFSAPVQDTPAVGFLRPDSQGGYGPLDRVTASVEGATVVDVVRQVSVKAAPGQLSIVPTIGAPGEGTGADLVRRLRDAERLLAQIARA